MFNPDVDFETNIAEMSDAIANVQTGQVTYAIKDTTYEGLEIKANVFMGIKDKEIVIANPDKMDTTRKLLDMMLDEDSELVTLIYGEGVSEDEAQEIVDYIEENYDAEVELNFGGHPVYSFIIGVE